MLSQWQLGFIANTLKQSGVIAYPTESVYGLGCDPQQLVALQRLITIKKRAIDKGLIILVSRIEQALPFIQPLTQEQLLQISKKQPRATTWLVPRKSTLSELLCGQHKKIAIRLTQHPIAKAICDYSDKALVSTSCNISGKPAIKQTTVVRNKMIGRVDQIVAGQCGGQAPSQIIDLLTGKIIRH
jgi:L-threonylcarbamoyladenylate synthase